MKTTCMVARIQSHRHYRIHAKAARSMTLPNLLLKLQWAVDNIDKQADLNENVWYGLLDRWHLNFLPSLEPILNGHLSSTACQIYLKIFFFLNLSPLLANQCLEMKKPHLDVQLWLDDDWAHWDGPEKPRLGSVGFFCWWIIGNYPEIHCDREKRKGWSFIPSLPTVPPDFSCSSSESNSSFMLGKKERGVFSCCCKMWTSDGLRARETSVWCRLGQRDDGTR